MKQILSNETANGPEKKIKKRGGNRFIHAENKCNLPSSHCDFINI